MAVRRLLVVSDEMEVGGSQRQITHFTDDREILDVAWSRDGTRLAVARATQTRDVVLIKGLKK